MEHIYSHFGASGFLDVLAPKYKTIYLSIYIADHLEQNNILTPRQNGIRRNYSCETQLVTTIDDWAKTIDKTKQTDVMTFDFSKAFDVVAHQRLLSELWNSRKCK